jgi:hypothetical protein
VCWLDMLDVAETEDIVWAEAAEFEMCSALNIEIGYCREFQLVEMGEAAETECVVLCRETEDIVVLCGSLRCENRRLEFGVSEEAECVTTEDIVLRSGLAKLGLENVGIEPTKTEDIVLVARTLNKQR